MRWWLLVLVACGRIGFDPGSDPSADDGGITLVDAQLSSVDAAALTCGSRMAATVPENAVISGMLADSVENATGTCGGDLANDWLYAIDVPPGGALITALDLGPDNATLVHVRTTCDLPASEIACNRGGGRGSNASWRTDVIPAGRYWVFADGNTAGTNSFSGRIHALLPEGAACSPANARDACAPDLSCILGTCQPTLCNPMTVTLPLDTTVTTTGRPNGHAGSLSCSEGNDSGSRSPEIVLRVVLSSPVTSLQVSTKYPETTYDTLLYVRDACHGVELGCNDGTPGDEVTTGALPAGDYFIFVDGFGGKSGTARVTITANVSATSPSPL